MYCTNQHSPWRAKFEDLSIIRCQRASIQVAARRRGAGAFTFIEIMVVVVIIGILAAAVSISASHYLNKAKTNRAKADIATYGSALSSYYAENGRYPTPAEGLAILVPKYIDKLRKDPWSRPYVYNQPGRNGPYEIICYGADGKEGGQGADADITSFDEDSQELAK
jgi:general secretion pathway protein G